MRFFRHTLPILLPVLLISILPLSSCKKKEPDAGKIVIGVTLLTRAHVFYKDLEDGLRKAADRYGYVLIVTAGEFDLGKQSAQIEDFITRKVDAIVVAPVDSRGIGPAIRKANEAKIPVFTSDIASQEGDVVCHIASDNVAGGRLAGEFIARALGGKGLLAVIGQPTVTSVLDRVQGFRDAIAKYPGLSIVTEVNGEGVRDKAMQAASRWSTGDTVKLSVALDTRPRNATVPKELKIALAKSSKAKAAFDGLAPSHRKAYVDWIEEVKRPETRERRVGETVARLVRGEKFR